MTSPAEELRETARLMRKRAQEATPGPWREDYGWVYPVDATVLGSHPWGAPLSVATARSTLNGEHIASWHPTVALAVADWLDYEAENSQEMYEGPDNEHAAMGLIVARAYLGTDREPS